MAFFIKDIYKHLISTLERIYVLPYNEYHSKNKNHQAKPKQAQGPSTAITSSKTRKPGNVVYVKD